MPFTTPLPAENVDPWYGDLDTAWGDLTVFIDQLEVDVATKASSADLSSGLATKVNSSTYTAGMAAKADLVGGVIPTSQIPALAVTEFLGTSANEAAMLAKVGQKGDWTTRLDTGSTWIITGDTPSNLSSWTSVSYPGAPVTTVNGQAGAVVLSAADVGAVPTARTVNGKALSGNITLVAADFPDLAPLDGAHLENATVDDPDPEGDPLAIANIGTVLSGRQDLIDALTLGLTGVDKRIFYDPVDGWPSFASQGPAWMLAVMHIIWDSVGHGTSVITPPDMIDGQDWDRDRVVA